jgi:Calcineurin-like phosphoesterase
VIDVIGDVHGQFDKLVALLTHLEYAESGGAWRHASRSAVFVGDLIDRGPKQLATIELVRAMVDAESAQCIMGNHEFNAIAWASPDRNHPGEFLRPHGKPGNLQQHKAFLSELAGTPKYEEVIAWFKTLPLWLELPGLRIVHACWHQASIDLLKEAMGSSPRLTDEMLKLGSRKGHPIYRAIETVCKGPEVELPNGMSIQDKEGRVRREVRVKWWAEDLSTYRKATLGPGDMEMIPDVPMPGEMVSNLRGLPQDVATRGAREASRSHASDSPSSSERTDARTARPDGENSPVVFGHDWFAGTPQVISTRFACVDYSAAHEGPLVAYRWDGEAELSSDKLAWIGDENTIEGKISLEDLLSQVAQPEQCVDCENRLSGEDFGRQWLFCKFCSEAVCKSCATSHYCEKQRSMNPHKRR